MGMFSFIEKGLGLRTGATQAAKEAKVAGEVQMGLETDFMGEIGDIYNPTIQQGQQAFTGLADYYEGNQQPVINQAMSSPMYSTMQGVGESAIARNAQATGGFRSGSTNENLAQNSQQVLASLIQQILQGKAGIADAGMNAANNYTNAGANMLGQIGGTSSQIANVDINSAANKQGILTGLFQAGAGMATASMMPTPASVPVPTP